MPSEAKVYRPSWLDTPGRDFSKPDGITDAQYIVMLRRTIRETAGILYTQRGSFGPEYKNLYGAYTGTLPIPKRSVGNATT